MTTGIRSVDFFIIGVQKGGTTALASYLVQASLVQMAKGKESHFFDNESVDWNHPDYRPFHAHFDSPQGEAIVRGEATPIYIYWPGALERIRRYNPAAKLILCLRHPAYRAYSHWRMETMRAAETMSFEDATSEAGRERVRRAEGGVHHVYSYVERGFYARQIRELQKLFPPEQLLFLRTDDLWSNAEPTLRHVHRFLGIGAPAPVARSYITPLRSDGIGPIPAAALRRLNDLFAGDIHETSDLTSLSLTDWLKPDYSEPMNAIDRLPRAM